MTQTPPHQQTPWQNLVGKNLGTSDWFTVDQPRINAFADVTMDHQFIHIDPQAAAQTPFGGTVAHGLLVLSLLPHLLYPMFTPYQSSTSTFINYGSDKVRFIHPVRSGSDIRCHAKVLNCESKDNGSTLLRINVVVEIRGQEKPALISDALVLILNN